MIVEMTPQSLTPVTRERSKRGFTLLEIMVALAMIAIVLVAVYRMQAQTISMNIIGRFQTIAPFLAQQVMADIETTPADELFDGSGDFGASFPNLTWSVTVEEFVSETFGEIGKDFRRINVTITSTSDKQTYNLLTYRLVRE
jgi:general secretion pathway protein I